MDEILAQILEDIPYRETKFKNPPKTDYVVYSDSMRVHGGDFSNLIEEHSVTFELYQYEVNKPLERKIEANFNRLGIDYMKQERYWINDEKLYQILYEFDFTRRIKK